MQDGVIVADGANRIIYANAAARAVLWRDDSPHTVPAQLLDAGRDDESASWPASSSRQGEVKVGAAAGELWLDVRIDPVRDRWNEVAGQVIVVRDITRRKLLEREREKLVSQLASAVGTVRTLEGILPLCAGCRKIREKDNSWSTLDAYVRRHTSVDFTHSFCPDCIERLYGEELGES
jgi:signal transduction histidine kinase